MDERQHALKDEVEELMEAANCFALARIEEGLAGDLDALTCGGSLVEAGFRLVNQYLLPNLEFEEIEQLNALARARRVCSAAVNTPRAGMTPAESAKHERHTTQCELAFMRERRRVLHSRLMSRLTPLQRRILKREYLVVPFLS